MLTLANLAKLFAQKSAEERILEAASLVDAATWAYLWLEYQAVAKALSCVEKIEHTIDHAHLENIDDGVEIGYQYLAVWAAEIRRKIDRLIRSNTLLSCNSISEVDRQKSQLWKQIENELDKATSSLLSYISSNIETGRASLLFPIPDNHAPFLFRDHGFSTRVYTASELDRKHYLVKVYRRSQQV